MHVSAPMHDPRFAAQLVEAQRQQSLVLDADAADGSGDARTAPAYEQTVVAYDRRRYALREAFTEVLGLTCPLERLHTALPHFSPRRDAHTATMADKRALLAPPSALPAHARPPRMCVHARSGARPLVRARMARLPPR